MTKVATICARGGSQGVPGKNIKELCGKPLIAYTISQALENPDIESVFVSTDCPDIAAVAKQHGAEVPFMRPANLATSTAPKIPVIQHLVDFIVEEGVNVDTIVDLDPTSPLRSQEDIDACIGMLDETVDVVITGYPSEKNPYFNMVECGSDGFVGLVKPGNSAVVARQLAPEVYSMNASIYVWHKETLDKGLWNGRTKIHVMPRERSIDIDSDIDFLLVELLMNRRSSES